MMKIEGSGSGSGSISQRHGSADPDPDPDPHQNVMDPQKRVTAIFRLRKQISTVSDRTSVGDRIRMFLGLPDSDPLVRGTALAPEPSIIKQK
jgi:hypothetical protein